MANILITLILSLFVCGLDSYAETPAPSKAGTLKARESIKSGVSIDNLKGARLSAAIGHFSRARQLLIAAVNEFDAGLKIGNPDLLIDSASWRDGVLSQANELDKVLSPQAAEARGGIKYQGDSRLLTESKP